MSANRRGLLLKALALYAAIAGLSILLLWATLSGLGHDESHGWEDTKKALQELLKKK